MVRARSGCSRSRGPPRSRPSPACRCRSRTTSGRNAAAASSAGRAVVGDPDLVPLQPQQHAPGCRRRPRCRPRPGCGGAAGGRGGRLAPPAARRPAVAGSSGRRTTNSLPWPGPSLRASTLPPCISTSRLTSVRPIPSPPCDRSSAPVDLDEQLEDAGQHVRRRCRCRCPAPRTTTSPPSRLGRQPDAAARRRCTWRRCSAGCRPPGPAGSGRPPGQTGSARQGDGQLVAGRPRSSGRLVSTAARHDRRQVDRAPCGARSCPG